MPKEEQFLFRVPLKRTKRGKSILWCCWYLLKFPKEGNEDSSSTSKYKPKTSGIWGGLFLSSFRIKPSQQLRNLVRDSEENKAFCLVVQDRKDKGLSLLFLQKSKEKGKNVQVILFVTFENQMKDYVFSKIRGENQMD